jgi:hypothetical protein
MGVLESLSNPTLFASPSGWGAVHRYQSVWTFSSSICVAAVATPKRKLPRPEGAAIDPGCPKTIGAVIVGVADEVAVASGSPRRRRRRSRRAATRRGADPES